MFLSVGASSLLRLSDAGPMEGDRVGMDISSPLAYVPAMTRKTQTPGEQFLGLAKLLLVVGGIAAVLLVYAGFR